MKFGKQLLATALLASTVSLAQADFYAGGGYLFTHYDESGLDDLDLGALYGTFGAQLADWIAVEARLGVGVVDDSVRYYGTRIDVELKHLYGAYVLAGIPNNSRFYPYAALGYSHLKLKASGAGFSGTESGSDLSYGAGVDVKISDTVSANLEYMRYYSKDDLDVDGIALGVKFRF